MSLGPNQPRIEGVPWYLGRYIVRDVKLIAQLFLVTRLRMTGAIPLLPLYVFMEWTGKTLRKIIRRNCAELST
jgi:hypothetical protein